GEVGQQRCDNDAASTCSVHRPTGGHSHRLSNHGATASGSKTCLTPQPSRFDGDGYEWLERIAELKDLVQQHINGEENKIFSAARKALDERRAEELGQSCTDFAGGRLRAVCNIRPCMAMFGGSWMGW